MPLRTTNVGSRFAYRDSIKNIPFEGIFLYKENNEWIVSDVSRSKIYKTYGRFNSIVYAAVFCIDMLFLPNKIGEVESDFYNALNKNVPEYDE